MFGMSSTEFWEDDPQLYWAYRIFYLKQKEVEQQELEYDSWLKGSMNYVATSLAIQNNFVKNSKAKYPNFDEMFKETKKEDNVRLSKKAIDKKVANEFNTWARY